jgi:hypothetical protein
MNILADSDGNILAVGKLSSGISIPDSQLPDDLADSIGKGKYKLVKEKVVPTPGWVEPTPIKVVDGVPLF